MFLCLCLVTVTNRGDQATGALTASLSGTNSSSFTLSTTSISSIAANGTSSFTVVPKTGLAQGTHIATVTVGDGYSWAAFIVSFSVISPSTPYIINRSGTVFTATRNSVTIGTANQTIQNVINAIRTHAAGADCAIQFGNGTTVLDIGTATAGFNNTGGTWGVVTLTGKITGTNSSMSTGIITIAGAVSVTSTADITNTYVGSYDSNAIFNNSTGTLTISGGTVSATAGTAVFSAGTLTISGGTVSATTGVAIYNASTGKISIPYPGTAVVSSANTSSTSGTIYLANVSTSVERLIINSGTVENTAQGGYAVYNAGGPSNASQITIDSGATITGLKYGCP